MVMSWYLGSDWMVGEFLQIEPWTQFLFEDLVWSEVLHADHWSRISKDGIHRYAIREWSHHSSSGVLDEWSPPLVYAYWKYFSKSHNEFLQYHVVYTIAVPLKLYLHLPDPWFLRVTTIQLPPAPDAATAIPAFSTTARQVFDEYLVAHPSRFRITKSKRFNIVS